MEIRINRKKFIQSLSLGSSFSGKNKVLPALDYVKFNVKDCDIKLSSNDGEIAINTIYRSAVTEYTGEFFADPKLILSALKTLKDEEVELYIVDERTMEIRHRNGKFSIPLGCVDEYPTPKMDENVVKADVSSEILFKWVKEARLFVASDELRPIMNGILLYYKDGEFGVCASDGHKLYTDHTKCIFEFGDVDAVLSDKAISALLDMINGTESTKIFFGDRNIAFKAGDTSIMCRKIEGRYPNFKAVIPSTHSIDCYCNKNEFQDSLMRVLTMANSTSLVKMELKNLECKLIAEDFDFSRKGEDLFAISSLNKNITIGFKGIFMKDCLDSIDSESVLIEMTDPSRAIVIKDNVNLNKTLLLMPMFLG